MNTTVGTISQPPRTNENNGYDTLATTVVTPRMPPMKNENLIRFGCSGISCMCAGFSKHICFLFLFLHKIPF